MGYLHSQSGPTFRADTEEIYISRSGQQGCESRPAFLEHMTDPVAERMIRAQLGRFQDVRQVPVIDRNGADFRVEGGLDGCH